MKNTQLLKFIFFAAVVSLFASHVVASQTPTLEIISVTLEPDPVPVNQAFNFYVKFKADIPDSADNKITTVFYFKVLQNNKILFPSKSYPIKVNNGKITTRTQHMKPVPVKGVYTIKVFVKYKELLTEKSITLTINKSGSSTRQDHHNAPPTSQNNESMENKPFVYNSQKYVSNAKKIANDLGVNAKRYSTEKNKKLQKQLVQNVKKAVSGDNAEGYYLLALLHQNGIDEISRDSKMMIENLMISAQKGYIEAQFILGDMYKDGDEVIKDKEKAIYWLQKAADQGHQGAKMQLELMEPQIHGKEPRIQLLGKPFPEN